MNAASTAMNRTTTPREPIAIVGMSCRLPGAASIPAFWDLLVNGGDAIREIPVDRFDVDALYHAQPATPGRIMTRWGGFLDDIDRFDAEFFGISPREADRLDPQQRLLLELTWEALEDAGCPPATLAGSRTGVVVGLWLNDYEARLFQNSAAIDFYMTTGTGRYTASGRLSHIFGLEGPSLTVDTACSSSLVALHLACRSLRAGECDLAIVGAANVLLEPSITIAYSQSRMMAPDGRCKFGDLRGDGYVRSDGAAVVVLKPVAQAAAEGDRIYSVILGSAVNNDGSTGGSLGTPSRHGQERMLRLACDDAGVAPAELTYVEAHGTGTRAGDPVELEALGTVLGTGRAPEHPCRIGSVKTNIGHTEAAAGLAGLIKVALSLRNETLPASLHFESPNPLVPWDRLPVVIQSRRTEWPRAAQARRVAGVSSFGIAGTNAHVVLAEAPPALPQKGEQAAGGEWQVLAISARTSEALRSGAARWGEFLRTEDSASAFRHICYTAAVRRTHHPCRLTLVARAAREAADLLDAFLAGEGRQGLATGQASDDSHKVVFVFPGQGSQWLGMGRTLFGSEPAFRAAMERCDAAVRVQTGWSVVAELHADARASRLSAIDVVQPVLFSIQLALAALWRSWGIRPDAVVGHSMGEIAAAHVAGALSLEDAARIICQRSALLRQKSGQGAMAVVELSLEQAQQAIAPYASHLSVAVSNSVRSTVVSGDPDALDALLAGLDGRGIFCRRVNVDVASHSPQMDSLRAPLLSAIQGIRPAAASVTFCSTVLGRPIDGATLVPEYWSRNLREPVLFSTAVRHLLTEGYGTWIEISAHPLLVGSVQENASEVGSAGVVVPSIRREEDEQAVMRASLGALHCHGVTVDWSRLFPERGRVVSLPPYPWQRERFWYEARAARPARGRGAGADLLGDPIQPALQAGSWYWEFDLGVDVLPWLADHKVRDSVVVPAAFFVQLAVEAAARMLRGEGCRLERLAVAKALVVATGASRVVQVAAASDAPGRCSVRILSRDGGTAGDWMEHASAVVLLGGRLEAPERAEDQSAVESRCLRPFDAGDHQRGMARRGLEYGPLFRKISGGCHGHGELIARVETGGGDQDGAPTLQERTSTLDACFQLVVAALTGNGVNPADTYVPVALETLDLSGSVPAGTELWCHARIVEQDAAGETITGDFDLADREGAVFCRGRGLRLLRIERALDARVREALGHLAWRPESRPAVQTGPSGAWVIAGAETGLAASIVSRLAARGVDATLAATGQIPELTARWPGRRRFAYVEDARPLDPAGLGDAAMSALALTKSVAALEEPAPRLWLITVDSHAVTSCDALSGLSGSLLWGLRSVVASEYPSLNCSAVDLSAAPGGDELEELLDEILADGPEHEVALRGSTRFVRRLGRGISEASADGGRQTPAAGRPYRATTSSPGILDGLGFEECLRRPSADGEVEIEVAATGLNFINVMSALGIYPGAPQGVGPLGIECAGRVVRAGRAVTRFRPGDHVMAFAHGSLASHALADERLVAAIPSGQALLDAATVPIAFLTAAYALQQLGRVAKGERVLIHSATGGVGLAAMQIARNAGAEVFATAGSAEKREWLRSLGVEHVADSRSLDFVREFRQATRGEGVDIVLNSLAGEAIAAGLSLLREGGRFLEIGKRDIYENRAIGLFPFHRNVSYFAIDLERLARERPDVLRGILDGVVAQFASGALAALPARVFAAAEVTEAFRLMARGAHTGKIVIAHDRDRTPLRPRRSAIPADWAAGTYLITGGTGGLGLTVARWLADQGARSVVLVGRRGEDAALASTLGPLREAGLTIEVMCADVSSSSDVSRVLEQIDGSLPPLAGVIHAAGILDDATVATLDAERFARVLAPKVRGAWNLHEATAGRALDFFVLFSSVTSFIGSAGQANYAAANAFLDSLAAYRRARGLPAQTINWGPWSEVGLAAQRTDRGARLADRGLGSLTPEVGVAALAEVLRRNASQAAVMFLDVARWCDGFPAGRWPLFAEWLVESDAKGEPAPAGGSLREALEQVPAGRRRQALLEDHVRQAIAGVLKLAPARVDPARPLRSMGLDSLMGLELRSRLEAATGIRLPATVTFSYPTVTALVPHLAERMGIPLSEASEPDSQTAREQEVLALLEEIEQLPDGDVRALLTGPAEAGGEQ